MSLFDWALYKTRTLARGKKQIKTMINLLLLDYVWEKEGRAYTQQLESVSSKVQTKEQLLKRGKLQRSKPPREGNSWRMQ